MMMWFNITPERLQKEMTIETPIGQKLYWDYYCYVKQHPINTWSIDTNILYGAKDELCEFETINDFVKNTVVDQKSWIQESIIFIQKNS